METLMNVLHIRKIQKESFYYQSVLKQNNSRRRFNTRIIEYKRKSFELSYISQLNKRAQQGVQFFSSLEQQSFGTPKCMLPIYFLKHIMLPKPNTVKLVFIKGKTSAYFQDGLRHHKGHTIEEIVDDMIRAHAKKLFEPDPKKEGEWVFRFEKDADAQAWYDLFKEDLQYITEQFKKQKISKENQLVRKSTIVEQGKDHDHALLRQKNEKYVRIKPLVIDHTQEPQLSQTGQMLVEQKNIRLELFKRELERKNKELRKMQVMDSHIQEQQNNIELQFQFIMQKAFPNSDTKIALSRLDKLKYVSQLSYLISRFKSQCFKAVDQVHPQVVATLSGQGTVPSMANLTYVKKQTKKGLLKMHYRMPGVHLEIRCLWPYKVINDTTQEISTFRHHLKKLKNRFKYNQILLMKILQIQMNDDSKGRCDHLHSVPLSMLVHRMGFVFYLQSHVLKEDSFSKALHTHGVVGTLTMKQSDSAKNYSRKKKDIPTKKYAFSSDHSSDPLLHSLSTLLHFGPFQVTPQKNKDKDNSKEQEQTKDQSKEQTKDQCSDKVKDQVWSQYLSHDLRIYRVDHSFRDMNIQNEVVFSVKYLLKTQNLMPVSIDIESEKQQNKNNKLRVELLDMVPMGPLNPNAFMVQVESTHDLEVSKANWWLRHDWVQKALRELEEWGRQEGHDKDAYHLTQKLHTMGFNMGHLGTLCANTKDGMLMVILETQMVCRCIKVMIENNLVVVQMQAGQVDGPDYYADQLNLFLGLSGAIQKDTRFQHSQESKRVRQILVEMVSTKFDYEISLIKVSFIIDTKYFNETLCMELKVGLTIDFSEAKAQEGFYYQREHVQLLADYDEYELHNSRFLSRILSCPAQGYKSHVGKVLLRYRHRLLVQACALPSLKMTYQLIECSHALVNLLVQLKDFQAAMELIPQCFLRDCNNQVHMGRQTNLQGRLVEMEALVQLATSQKEDGVWMSHGKPVELQMSQAAEDYKAQLDTMYPTCPPDTKYIILWEYQIKISALTLHSLPQLFVMIEQQKSLMATYEKFFGPLTPRCLSTALSIVSSLQLLRVYELSENELSSNYNQAMAILNRVSLNIQNSLSPSDPAVSIQTQDMLLQALLKLSNLSYLQGHLEETFRLLPHFQRHFNRFQYLNKNRFQNNFQLFLYSSVLLTNASAIRLYQRETRQDHLGSPSQRALLQQHGHVQMQQMGSVLKQLWPTLQEQLSLSDFLNETMFQHYVAQFCYLLSFTLEHYFSVVHAQMSLETQAQQDKWVHNMKKVFAMFQMNRHKKSSQQVRFMREGQEVKAKPMDKYHQSIYPETSIIKTTLPTHSPSSKLALQQHLIGKYFVNFDGEAASEGPYLHNSQDNALEEMLSHLDKVLSGQASPATLRLVDGVLLLLGETTVKGLFEQVF